MCERPSKPKFLCHFGPQNETKFMFLNILLRFTWIHTNRIVYAHYSYFQICVQYGPCGQICGSFWAPKYAKMTFFCNFLKMFSLVLRQYRFTYLLPVLLVMCGLRAPEAQFLGHFWHPNKSKFRSLVIFSKVFTGFTSVLHYMRIWNTFRGVENTYSIGPIFGRLWAPE